MLRFVLQILFQVLWQSKQQVQIESLIQLSVFIFVGEEKGRSLILKQQVRSNLIFLAMEVAFFFFAAKRIILTAKNIYTDDDWYLASWQNIPQETGVRCKYSFVFLGFFVVPFCIATEEKGRNSDYGKKNELRLLCLSWDNRSQVCKKREVLGNDQDNLTEMSHCCWNFESLSLQIELPRRKVPAEKG